MNTKHLTFRIPIALILLIKRAAKEEGCTVTEIVIRALRAHL